jgi:hypothetical protein
MEPAPIDTLHERLPVFLRWRSRAEAVLNKRGSIEAERIAAAFALGTYSISILDNSDEATIFRTALGEWMLEHNFTDPWIRDDAAIPTLYYMADKPGSKVWRVRDSTVPGEIKIEITLAQRGRESDKEFLKRFAAECRKPQKAFAAQRRYELGQRGVPNVDPDRPLQPARWTVLAFCGLTVAEIVDHDNLRSRRSRRQGDIEEVVKKAIATFCKRAGLKRPQHVKRIVARGYRARASGI